MLSETKTLLLPRKLAGLIPEITVSLSSLSSVTTLIPFLFLHVVSLFATFLVHL